jgi:hypothetical protein
MQGANFPPSGILDFARSVFKPSATFGDAS